MERTFVTGSEWLYYKIYTGPKTADHILCNAIKPLTEILLNNNIIDSYFFIRYADPKLHIRLRLHHTNINNLPHTISLVHKYLEPYINDMLIWKISNETYNRELERYGYSLIEKTEEYFYHDSKSIIEILDLLEGNEGEIIRWQIALKAIDDLLTVFQYNTKQKLAFLEILRDSYGQEFAINKNLKTQLSEKYRRYKSEIQKIMNPETVSENELTPLYDILNTRNLNIQSFAVYLIQLEKENIIEIPISRLLTSYLHMMCNRFFKTKQRLHELVLYDLLCQYYTTELHRRDKLEQVKL